MQARAKTLRLRFDPRQYETPVFVSPYVHSPHECDCGVSYAPLVYRFGRETRAHHWHARGGGIYSYPANSQMARAAGFVAFGLAIGDVVEDRSPGIVLQRLTVSCQSCGVLPDSQDRDFPLWEWPPAGRLVFYCESCQRWGVNVPRSRFMLTVMDGQPLFRLAGD